VTAKKSSKIFRDFWQLSTLIANISGTDQYIENRNSSWKYAAPPTLFEKKLLYFGPQTKKLLTLINVHPNGLFSGDYISTLRGCCTLKFLHALKIDKALLAHTPRWDGVPQKIYNRENLKFGLKFNVLRSITSSLVGISSRDFFQSTLREAGLIIWVQFLQGPPPKICDGQKIVQISARFLISFDFDREYPQNGSTYRKSE